MFHIKNRDLVLAPTHEEIITHIAQAFVHSYRDMPQIWYQIQTKFRNEPRPKSGVIRSRQFLMKDAYSLDNSWEGLDASYQKHYEAYCRIYGRCGLEFFVVGASSGAMGGIGFAGIHGGIRRRVRISAHSISKAATRRISKWPRRPHAVRRTGG
jgi:prolyl-tRNA synthetase